MPSSRHTLLRSGQFAALCGLSKDTLRFYDRSGVLSPAFIGSNGYRFYSPAQLFEANLIEVLQSSGCSLSEIRGFVQGGKGPALTALLQQKEQALQEELRLLQQRQRMLVDLNAVLALSAAIPYDRLFFREFAQAEYVAVPCSMHVLASYQDFSSVLRDFLAQTERLQVHSSFPLGMLIRPEQVTDGSFTVTALLGKTCERVPDSCPEQNRVRLPGGTWACLAHSGPLASHQHTLCQLQHELQTLTEHYAVQGPLIAFDLLSWLQCAGGDDAITLYAMPVGRKNSGADRS